MAPPEDYTPIPSEKVFIEDYSSFTPTEQDERLQFQWFIKDGEVERLRLALIDALEVRILREDPDNGLDPIAFTWDIISFDERLLKLKLKIENAEAIADDLG